MEAKHQRNLLKTGALQKAILNSANFSSIATDENGLIQIFNIGAERMLGYTAAEVLNKLTPADLAAPDEVITLAIALSVKHGKSVLPGFEAMVFNAARGVEDIYELTYIRKDGTRLPTVVTVTALRDAQEAIIGYLLIGTDNTVRSQLEKVLLENNLELTRAKSVAEKANLAKSDFLSRMSHELRTPLNAVLGFAQLLQAGTPPLTETQAERMQQITKAGWYLLELINEILDLAVIESGKLSLTPEPVSLTDVMNECQAMIESQAQKHHTRLQFHPFARSWFAYADRTRVKQVLVNLLSNAIKYNCANGSVDVLCSADSPDRIRITIKDSGAGLSPQKLAQLFQPFNRLGQESGAEEGTGMGLVVAKQLVELMGGRIGVESTVGKGSEFWVELIRCTQPQPATDATPIEPETPPAQTNIKQGTLLYVEDNIANMMLVEHIIEAYTHVNMLSAHYGQLGISLARSHLPDVILMDINLPDISGVEALRILLEDPATRHIPVIALSANAMQHDIERGLDAGFFRYLTKPIKVNELLNALDDALRSGRIRSASNHATGGTP
ncbi:MAG: hybrid sensor histidine kinase/response regulator [Sideroxydans sp. GWF2_59_14]|nr:MAG: hybrid sensor histidine kinase/response regulator [Sideroxydans sp. GWF2_59_14]